MNESSVKHEQCKFSNLPDSRYAYVMKKMRHGRELESPLAVCISLIGQNYMVYSLVVA